MNDNERTIMRGVKALKEHKAIHDKTELRNEVASHVDAFLASGGEIEQIPSNLNRSASEMSFIAQGHMSSLDRDDLEKMRARQKGTQANSARMRNLTRTTSLGDMVK